MSQLSRIYVAGTGVINSLGANAPMIAAAVNAGISAVRDTAIFNKRLKPIRMACVPEAVLAPLNAHLATQGIPTRQERLLRMAGPALQQLQSVLPQNTLLPIVLALPEVIPGISRPWYGNAIEQLGLQYDAPLDLINSRAAEIGRAGGIHAIKHVFQLMEAGHDWVLLGGMDSYWDPELLAYLDADDRLLVGGTAEFGKNRTLS